MRIAIANIPSTDVEFLRVALSRTPQHDLAWIVKNNAEAVGMCAKSPPDLLLMGLPIPVSDAVDSTRQIMKSSPCPILVVAVNYERQISAVFEVMGAGALDVVNIPVSGSQEDARELLRKIEAIGKRNPSYSSTPIKNGLLHPSTKWKNLPQLIVVGASTGGPNAIAAILAALPQDFSAAILVVQHVNQQFAEGIARWLGQNCKLSVDIARSGDRPLAGNVLIASTDDHMVLTPDQTIAYTKEPADYPYRPSADVFFESAALHWPQPSVAVLLTGMGRDGAMGMMTLQRAGWHTIAQDKESCVVYGMPKAAIELGAARRILPPLEIAAELMLYAKSKMYGQTQG